MRHSKYTRGGEIHRAGFLNPGDEMEDHALQYNWSGSASLRLGAISFDKWPRRAKEQVVADDDEQKLRRETKGRWMNGGPGINWYASFPPTLFHWKETGRVLRYSDFWHVRKERKIRIRMGRRRWGRSRWAGVIIWMTSCTLASGWLTNWQIDTKDLVLFSVSWNFKWIPAKWGRFRAEKWRIRRVEWAMTIVRIQSDKCKSKKIWPEMIPSASVVVYDYFRFLTGKFSREVNQTETFSLFFKFSEKLLCEIYVASKNFLVSQFSSKWFCWAHLHSWNIRSLETCFTFWRGTPEFKWVPRRLVGPGSLLEMLSRE